VLYATRRGTLSKRLSGNLKTPAGVKEDDVAVRQRG
jgi:hypothetical protein